jgi:hypothetical protein
VALSTVREDDRDGYAQRLEAFTEQHRERLEETLRAYGPGSTPASPWNRSRSATWRIPADYAAALAA